MEHDRIVLSIRPQFVDAIFAGRKRFELRKRRPAIGPGAVVYVYCTAPRQAIVGRFVCGNVHAGRPEELWARFGRLSSICPAQFAEYFEGSEIGYALEIEQVVRWREPLSLSAIRGLTPRFWPPQFHRRIDAGEPLLRYLSERDRGTSVFFGEGSAHRQVAATGYC